MTIPEFFAIYRPTHYKDRLLAFTIWGKLQFITLSQKYSNNKIWHTEFFYVLGAWESSSTETLPED
jgi:hypothetical protein